MLCNLGRQVGKVVATGVSNIIFGTIASLV